MSRKYAVLPNSMLLALDWEKFKNSLRGCPKYASHFIACYTGNKPHCIYGHEVFTIGQILAKKTDPSDPIYGDSTLIDPGIPIEDVRYAVVPTADRPSINWSEDGIIGKIPVRFTMDQNLFAVAYDGTKPKPPCLANYNDVSRTEAKASISDPNNPWHIPYS